MAASRNPYLVNVVRQTNGAHSTHLGDKKMINALAVSLEDTNMFNELAQDTINFSHDGNRATKESTAGIYHCYFLDNGILLSCTTNIQPSQVRRQVSGFATEIHSTAMRRSVEIPSYSPNVLWHNRAR